MKLEFPSLEYLQNKNIYTGSYQKFNYRLAPTKETIKVSFWYGLFCYDKSELVDEIEVELSDAGLNQAITELTKQCEVFQQTIAQSRDIDWLQAYLITKLPQE